MPRSRTRSPKHRASSSSSKQTRSSSKKLTTTSAVSSSSTLLICKYCHEEEANPNDVMFPCSCSSPVHRACLETWASSRLESEGTRTTACEVCGKAYVFEWSWSWEKMMTCMMRSVFANGLVLTLCFFLQRMIFRGILGFWEYVEWVGAAGWGMEPLFHEGGHERVVLPTLLAILYGGFFIPCMQLYMEIVDDDVMNRFVWEPLNRSPLYWVVVPLGLIFCVLGALFFPLVAPFLAGTLIVYVALCFLFYDPYRELNSAMSRIKDQRIRKR